MYLWTFEAFILHDSGPGQFGQISLKTEKNQQQHRESKWSQKVNEGKRWLKHYVYKLTPFGKCSKPLIECSLSGFVDAV